MTVTRALILAIMPAAEPANVDLYLPHAVAAAAEYGIDTLARGAAFIATVAMETGQLDSVEENLNYSAHALAATWPNRYAACDANGEYRQPIPGHYVPNALANSLHRRPEAIANNCYANRMGNRDEASGDGWRFRGSGGIQETGRDNHYAAALHFDKTLEGVSEWLRSPEGAMRSAAWGFARRGCLAYADRGDFDGVSDLINLGRKTAKLGDSIGYAQRLTFFNRAQDALKG